MSSNLKFHFSNIGPVDNAELELGNLTVIAGRNNTGKTYLAHTLYGFLRDFGSLLRSTIDFPALDAHIAKMTSLSEAEFEKKLIDEGRIVWEDDQDLSNQLQIQLLQEMSNRFTKSGISKVFNTTPEYFKNTKMKVEIRRDFGRETTPGVSFVGGRMLCKFHGTRVEVSVEKLKPEATLNFDPGDLYYWLKFLYLQFIFQLPYTHVGRPVSILTSSRLAISLFYKELVYARSQLEGSMQQMEDDHSGESSEIVDLLRQTSRYSIPVQDDIYATRDWPRGFYRFLTEQGSEQALENASAALVNLIGGRLEVKDDDVRFIAQESASRSFDIPLHLASSSVGEMTNLFFLLDRLVGRADNFLIIDEPESHLDTANQIQFARLLVNLVNSGVPVLITTHSDYIIRELNNLIMLDMHFEDKEEITQRLGYSYSSSLDPSLVRAYVAENNTLTRCEINHFGMDMPVFDKTIDEINKVTYELASSVAIELEEE